MKSKNGPQTTRQKIVKLISIRPSMIVFALWLGLQIFEGMLDDPRIFYPLWVVIHSDWEFLLAGFIFVIIVLQDGFRLRRRQYHNTVVLSIVIQNTLFLLVMMLFATGSPRLTHLQSVSTDQHMYNLEQTIGSYDTRYNVSECDQTGLTCHYYANPFTSTPECFKEGGVLELEPITKGLVLHIGPDTYPVDPAIPMYRNPLCYIWSDVFRP